MRYNTREAINWCSRSKANSVQVAMEDTYKQTSPAISAMLVCMSMILDSLDHLVWSLRRLLVVEDLQ